MEQLETMHIFGRRWIHCFKQVLVRSIIHTGSSHPVYANLNLSGSTMVICRIQWGTDTQPIHVFKGKKSAHNVGAIVISADILKKDCEVKLLVGCDEEEK